tara:strand:+ start:3027 stop:3527 length:501 start_codon:yes stop_codon:yes gene_type:complete
MSQAKNKSHLSQDPLTQESTSPEWIVSPITGKTTVLQEFSPETGVSKMDLSSGFYTNEYPLNYKKHPDFNYTKFEEGMPANIKNLKYDDGESWWYMAPLQTSTQIVFPVGDTLDELRWCYAPIKDLTEEEKLSDDFGSKIVIDEAEYYESYIEAIKNINGYNLGNI